MLKNRLLRRLKRKLGRAFADDDPAVPIQLNGVTFTNARLFSKKSGQGESKAGLLTWRARMNGRPVKICEYYSDTQAIFIQSLTQNKLLAPYLPPILMRVNNCLVVDWIVGEHVFWKDFAGQQLDLEEIAKIQALLHAQSVSCESGFSYQQFLIDRVQRYQGVFPIWQQMQEIVNIFDSLPVSPLRLSHPDLTAVNLIKERETNTFKLIDNELLTQNRYCLIDLFNTHKSMGVYDDELIESYLRAYVHHGGQLTPIVENREFYIALWYIRLIGSCLQSGSVAKVSQLLSQFEQDIATGHPFISFIEERFI